METNVRILKLCPNVEHVEIRGFEASELDALVNVLKNKSLLSFQISSKTLCGNFVEGVRSYSHIFDMMESWPKLRNIKVLSFMSYDAPDLIPSGSPQVSPRCPDLRDIEISGALLRVNEVARMRAMCCGGVTRLSVSYLDVYVYPGAIVALCNCLCAWSSTLEYFEVRTHWESPSSYWPLYEVMNSLTKLRELKLGFKLGRMEMDAAGSIARLPRLERLHCALRGEELQTLSRQLEDLKKFPSSIASYSTMNPRRRQRFSSSFRLSVASGTYGWPKGETVINTGNASAKTSFPLFVFSLSFVPPSMYVALYITDEAFTHVKDCYRFCSKCVLLAHN